MSSKPNSSVVESVTPLFCALPSIGLLRVHGRDARDFLQRQSSNDLRRLDADGAAQWSSVLSAKGRVLSLFRLLREAEDAYLLLCFGEDADWLAGELRRYVFRSKLSIECDNARLAVGAIGRPPADGAPAWLDWDSGRRIALVAASAAPATSDQDASHWRDIDLWRGLPHVDASQREKYTPHMLGLAQWSAFSLSKGCYPGQEIVARTHYLGQQKRQLQWVAAAARLAVGEALYEHGTEVGRVVCTASTPARGALAVVASSAGEHLATASGAAVQARSPDPAGWPD